MSAFRAKALDISLEKQIITTMIVNTDYLREIAEYLQVDYFTTPYITTVAEWVLEYFDEYGLAPNKQIKAVFEQNEIRMDEDEAELFRTLLQNLSDTFVAGEEEENFDYLRTRTLNFCQKRELEITAGNIKHYLEQDDLQNAEAEILHFRKVAPAISECVDVFDVDVVKEVFKEREKGVLQLPRYLGEFLGSWHRSWLVVFSGAYKRGKSWWLLDAYINSALQGQRVIFFSLEMTQENILERIYHRVTGCAKEAKETIIPVIDCKLNQSAECMRDECPCHVPLILPSGEMPTLEEAGLYRA
ncbi:MAG: hypothetical protein KAH38_13255, partial [Candidatus Hydrogenedentes bacterium]|nr:hypothetical protein [Candidatus Hydrogenedentota bacterium]